ncbi:MAG: MaoC/PaaZ C-terminal domain-containing protein [Promethearchaeota archaeon]|jgi:acyl dehydratase
MTSLDLNAIGKESKEVPFKYNWRDVILYNLGIGAQPDELPFVYERTPGGVKVFPSYACIVAGVGFANIRLSPKGIDGPRFIHGEQMIKMYKPFPTEAEILVKAVCENMYDKGKAAVIHTKISGRMKDGSQIFDAKYVHFYIGEGGWGGDRGPKAEPLDPPEGKDPDFSISYKTNINQAALYRLNGDFNPLHLDPVLAKSSGRFDRPILHGLCTYGFATRAIVYGLCDGEVSRFKEFNARFTSEVYPGETLTTEGWKDNGRYIIQVRTERATVLGNAYAIVE